MQHDKEFENDLTFRLFSIPAFTEGMGSVLDLADALSIFNESATAEDADAAAVRSDWMASSADMMAALRVFDGRVAADPDCVRK